MSGSPARPDNTTRNFVIVVAIIVLLYLWSKSKEEPVVPPNPPPVKPTPDKGLGEAGNVSVGTGSAGIIYSSPPPIFFFVLFI